MGTTLDQNQRTGGPRILDMIFLFPLTVQTSKMFSVYELF